VGNGNSKDLKDMTAIDPVTGVAETGNVNQGKMALTPAAKQGIAGIQSPFTNKGNIHSVTSVNSTDVLESQATSAKPLTEEQRQKKTQSLIDITEEQRKLAIDQVATSGELKKLGSTGESLQKVLLGKINGIFNSKSATVAKDGVEGLSQLGQSEELLAGLTGAGATAPVQTALKNMGKLDYIKDNLADGNWSALESKFGVGEGELRKFLRDNGKDPDGKSVKDIITDIDELMTSNTGDIGKAIGFKADPNDPTANIDWNKVSTIFPDKTKFLGTLLSTSLKDELKVDDTLLEDMGYAKDDIPHLKEVLGITDDESVAAFSSKVDQYLSSAYEDVRKASEIVGDPMASLAEKAEAVEKLKAMGYTGTLMAQEDVAKVAQELEDAETGEFEFAGQSMTLKEALSDKNITGLVEGYLAGDESVKLPEVLKDFVDNNRKFFEHAVAELQDEVGEFNDVQKSWKELENSVGKEDMQFLGIPGYDSSNPYYLKKADITSMPAIVQTLVNGSETDKINAKAVVTGLKKIPSVPPAVVSDIIKGLSPAQVKALGDSPESVVHYANAVGVDVAVRRVKDSNKTMPVGTSPAVKTGLLLTAAFGAADATEMMNNYTTLQDLASVGITLPGDPLRTMTILGGFDNPDAIGEALDGLVPDTLSDVAGIVGGDAAIKNSRDTIMKAVSDHPEFAAYMGMARSAKIAGTSPAGFVGVISKMPGNEGKTPEALAAQASGYLAKLNPELGQKLVNEVFGNAAKLPMNSPEFRVAVGNLLTNLDGASPEYKAAAQALMAQAAAAAKAPVRDLTPEQVKAAQTPTLEKGPAAETQRQLESGDILGATNTIDKAIGVQGAQSAITRTGKAISKYF
jgi:hypothetical protein